MCDEHMHEARRKQGTKCDEHMHETRLTQTHDNKIKLKNASTPAGCANSLWAALEPSPTAPARTGFAQGGLASGTNMLCLSVGLFESAADTSGGVEG